MRYLFLVLLFIGCNPVKQVLRDQAKLEEVAKVVVKGGWCASDTTFITKSDTLVEVDTLVQVDTITDTYIFNDTVYITKWKTKTITKTLTIRDTLKSFIVDNARIRLLQTDSSRLAYELNEWEGKAKRRQLWIFLLIGGIALYFYIKTKLW
ncbi:hypothetical protein UFOVP321_48 [uncultured Caudovirales phage]|uniref:Uncharacterized protein n=1 Tax=uncultured Caudovirales phage TaxID=2100421 RepID=A0A6J5LXJ4_9CAUD|nr:hypothetical protein UFOVP321_48 [uncultured Caudovirales phage]